MTEKDIEGMINNLANITNADPVYHLVCRIIAKYLPDDLKILFNASPQVQIIATDNYFTHYSIAPLLRGYNPDNILEEVRKIMANYLCSEEYQRIKPLTELDDELSLLFAIAFTRELLKRLRERIMQKAYLVSRGAMSAFISDVLNQAASGSKKAQEMLTDVATRILQDYVQKGEFHKILLSAVKEAEQRVKNANTVRELIGGKQAEKEPGTFEYLLDLSEALLKADVHEIVSLASKLIEALPKFTHLIKIRGRRGAEIAGYRLTKNPTMALPRELALPDDMFFMKFTSGGFLSREYLDIREGAYYVLIDKSGSMSGRKTIWARSVAMAIYELSRMRGRKYFLRFFDTRTYPDPDSPPLEDPKEVVKAILKVESTGGTDIDAAIRVALGDLYRYHLIELTNTIIVITDGEDTIEDLIGDLKKAGAELIAVMIEGNNESLAKVAALYTHAQLTTEGALKLIKAVKRR